MTAARPHHEAEAFLAQARAQFDATLLDRMMAVEAILARCALRGMTAGALREIRHHAHKTAGVAGTLGLNEIGLHAATVDKLLSQVLDGAGDAPDTSSLLDAIDRMQCAIEAHVAP